MELNNREIAVLFWLTLFFAVVLLKKGVRHAFWGVARAFCQPIILLALVLASAWITACLAGLKHIDLWDWSNLKTTLVWAVTFAFLTMFDVSRISEDRTYFGKTVRDILGATALVTFIAELYSFSLMVELLLVPLLTFVALLQAIAKTRPEHAAIDKLMQFILVGAGLSYFGYGLYRIATDFSEFATVTTLREFATPILLSFLFLPFIYGFSVYVTYENNFLRLNWLLEDRKLRRWTKLRAALAFGLNLDLLRRWSRKVAHVRPLTKSAVKDIIRAVKLRKRPEKNPPVDRANGWSPFAVKNLLGDLELPTGDYHPSFDDDEWYASSPMLELDDVILPNNLAYYAEGDQHVAKRLKLKLNVNVPEQATSAESRLWDAARELLQAVLDAREVEEAMGAIRSADTIDRVFGDCRIQLRREDFTGLRGGYSRLLLIEYQAGSNSSTLRDT